MMHAVIFLLALAGFGLLLIAMQRHQQDWFHCKLPPMCGRALRLSGFTVLALAFVLAGNGLGWAYGTVIWFGWVTIGSGLATAANAGRRRLLHVFGKAGR